MPEPSAAEWAAARVAEVRDDPGARLGLMRSLYDAPPGRRSRHLPYRRAALAFMGWQVRRCLLNPTGAPTTPPGSPWWRAMNERLLLDTATSRAQLLGHPATDGPASVRLSFEFASDPTSRRWYRAHNASIVAGYLDHRDLAARENRVERFFINLVLVRVLFAHALVAAPRLALGWAAPLAPAVGDPRLGMTGIFLSLSRVLPDSYPADGELERYVAAELGFARTLDIGIIRPRIADLFAWSADELEQPELLTLVDGDVPAYAWDAGDDAAWNQSPSWAARAARRLVR